MNSPANINLILPLIIRKKWFFLHQRYKLDFIKIFFPFLPTFQLARCCMYESPHLLLTLCIHSVVIITNNSSILSMITVTVSPAEMWTSCKRVFIPCAIDFVHPYWSQTTAKVGISSIRKCFWVPQHSTHHMSIIYVPLIIAYSAPLAVVVKGNATLIWVTFPIQ